MDENDQTSSPTEQTSRRTQAAVAAAVAILAVCAAVACFAGAHSSGQARGYDQSAKQSQGDATYEELVAQLDDAARESRLWISVASSMKANAQTGEVAASDAQGQAIDVLDNRPENTRDIVYSFALEDGTVIYESDLLKPGHSIASPVLSTHLSPGAYDVTVTAQGYDVESHNAVGGTVAAQATLNVE